MTENNDGFRPCTPENGWDPNAGLRKILAESPLAAAVVGGREDPAMNTRRRFIITGEAWYADAAKSHWGKRVRAEMSIGVDLLTDDGHNNGCIGEWTVTWEEIARGHIATRIKVFHGSWKPLIESGFPEIMTELDVSGAYAPAPTMEQMVEALRKRGWEDTTARVRPPGY